MDSLTHIAVGACIGDLFLGRKIGKKAMLYGAVAASLPDIDFIATLWLSNTDDLLAHRGFTHSFLFAILVVTGLAVYFRKRHLADHVPVKTWLIFLSTALLSHLFLDVFNAYGIGWFEPFNHSRISFHVIFVADPFFSVWPGFAAVCLLFADRYSKKRRLWAKSGLILCSLYLLYCLANKYKIDGDSRQSLVRRSIHFNRYFSTPAPFNSWLWYIVAETDSGFYIGYRSVFDKSNQIDFRFILKNDSLLKPFYRQRDLQQLVRFSQGYYTAESSMQGIVFNDLRFGQMMGWQYPGAPFVFHYYLQEPGANRLVIQRGRFANWNRETVRFYLSRILGK
jgi:inner membrane protein